MVMQKRGIYFIIIGLILGAVLGYSAFYYNDKIKPQHSYDSDGWKYFNQEKYDAAIYEFSTYLERDENNHFALEGMGWSLLREERFNEALADFEKAEKIEKTALLYEGMGWITYNSQDYDRAIEFFRNSLMMNPSNAKGYYGLGFSFYEKGMETGDESYFQNAMESFEKSKELNPEIPYTIYGLGLVLYHEERYREAAAMFARTRDFLPGYRGAYWGEAGSYYKLSKIEDLVKVYQELMEHDNAFKECIEKGGKGIVNESIRECIGEVRIITS